MKLNGARAPTPPARQIKPPGCAQISAGVLYSMPWAPQPTYNYQWIFTKADQRDMRVPPLAHRAGTDPAPTSSVVVLVAGVCQNTLGAIFIGSRPRPNYGRLE